MGRREAFPLLDAAVEIIRRQPRVEGDERIFRSGKSASARFTLAKKELGIKDLRFHDLRREAVMRMLEAGIPLDRVEKLTGLSLHMLEHYRAQYEAKAGNLEGHRDSAAEILAS